MDIENQQRILRHGGRVYIEGHPEVPGKRYYANECYWVPDKGWVVRGTGSSERAVPCTWEGHPWGDSGRPDEEGENW